jgi:hypothetical protein
MAHKSRFWPFCEVSARVVEVRIVEYSGPDLLTLTSSHFDPVQSFHHHSNMLFSVGPKQTHIRAE